MTSARSCGEIQVLIVGAGSFADRTGACLSAAHHPVMAVSSWPQAMELSPQAQVAIVIAGCAVEALDELRERAPHLRVIFVPDALDGEIESQVALREYVRLRVAGPNPEELHALVHDILLPAPDPRPTALA